MGLLDYKLTVCLTSNGFLEWLYQLLLLPAVQGPCEFSVGPAFSYCIVRGDDVQVPYILELEPEIEL